MLDLLHERSRNHFFFFLFLLVSSFALLVNSSYFAKAQARILEMLPKFVELAEGTIALTSSSVSSINLGISK